MKHKINQQNVEYDAFISYSICLWDCATMKKIMNLKLPGIGYSTQLGKNKILVKRDKSAVIVPIKPLKEVISEAKDRLNGRCLTIEERKEFFIE